MSVEAAAPIRRAWLDLTTRCQLECEHCAVSSGPTGTHGVMTLDNWQSVILDVAARGIAGRTTICFIGGEPSQHLGLGQLIRFAISHGLKVEVFTNLVAIPQRLWHVLVEAGDGLMIATSWYTADPAQHAIITGSDTAYGHTLGNIARALELGLRVRVGMTSGIVPDQDVEGGRALLIEMGIRPGDFSFDAMRPLGRGNRTAEPQRDEGLCGNCTNGVVSVASTGVVTPCLFAQHRPVGNVITGHGLTAVLDGSAYRVTAERLGAGFAERRAAALAALPGQHVLNCDPGCPPDGCPPDLDNGCWPHGITVVDCDPGDCPPSFGCPPDSEKNGCWPGGGIVTLQAQTRRVP